MKNVFVIVAMLTGIFESADAKIFTGPLGNFEFADHWVLPESSDSVLEEQVLGSEFHWHLGLETRERFLLAVFTWLRDRITDPQTLKIHSGLIRKVADVEPDARKSKILAGYISQISAETKIEPFILLKSFFYFARPTDSQAMADETYEKIWPDHAAFPDEELPAEKAIVIMDAVMGAVWEELLIWSADMREIFKMVRAGASVPRFSKLKEAVGRWTAFTQRRGFIRKPLTGVRARANERLRGFDAPDTYFRVQACD